MKNTTISMIVACGLFMVPSIVGAQKSEQPPAFRDAVVVKAAPASVRGALTDYYLTFSGPVGVPGVTLTAGTYLFRFPEGTGAGIIQVLKGDRSDAYAMFSTIPARNLQNPSRDTRIVMDTERPAGAPPVIKEWYLPGETTGFEFIYSKKPA